MYVLCVCVLTHFLLPLLFICIRTMVIFFLPFNNSSKYKSMVNSTKFITRTFCALLACTPRRSNSRSDFTFPFDCPHESTAAHQHNRFLSLVSIHRNDDERNSEEMRNALRRSGGGVGKEGLILNFINSMKIKIMFTTFGVRVWLWVFECVAMRMRVCLFP